MKRLLECNDLVPALGMPIPSCQLVKAFIRFSATIGKKDFSVANPMDQRLRQFALPRMLIKIGAVPQCLRLFTQSLLEIRMSMSQNVHSNAPSHVEIAFTLAVPDVLAFAFDKSQREPSIGLKDMVLKQLGNFRMLHARPFSGGESSNAITLISGRSPFRLLDR